MVNTKFVLSINPNRLIKPANVHLGTSRILMVAWVVLTTMAAAVWLIVVQISMQVTVTMVEMANPDFVLVLNVPYLSDLNNVFPIQNPIILNIYGSIVVPLMRNVGGTNRNIAAKVNPLHYLVMKQSLVPIVVFR